MSAPFAPPARGPGCGCAGDRADRRADDGVRRADGHSDPDAVREADRRERTPTSTGTPSSTATPTASASPSASELRGQPDPDARREPGPLVRRGDSPTPSPESSTTTGRTTADAVQQPRPISRPRRPAAPSQVKAQAEQPAAITLTKSASPTRVSKVGQVVTYRFDGRQHGQRGADQCRDHRRPRGTEPADLCQAGGHAGAGETRRDLHRDPHRSPRTGSTSATSTTSATVFGELHDPGAPEPTTSGRTRPRTWLVDQYPSIALDASVSPTGTADAGDRLRYTRDGDQHRQRHPARRADHQQPRRARSRLRTVGPGDPVAGREHQLRGLATGSPTPTREAVGCPTSSPRGRPVPYGRPSRTTSPMTSGCGRRSPRSAATPIPAWPTPAARTPAGRGGRRGRAGRRRRTAPPRSAVLTRTAS